MSANFPGIGNAGTVSGGGGGTPLGIEQNIFTAGTRAEAEAARDAYAQANPNWLDSYNENKDENIRLDYVDAQGNSIAVFQVRNAAGTRWNDNDTVIGLRGATGDAASLANVRLGHVPVKTSDNTFGDSGVQILEDGTVRIPEATLGIGDLIELSEATGFGIIYNNVDQAGYIILDARLTDTAGSSRPRQFVIGTPNPTPFESGGTDVLTANPLIFTRTLTGTGANFSLTFQTDSAMDNAKMRIVDDQSGVVFKHVPSRLAWEDDTEPGYNLRAGMNTVNFYNKEDSDPANGVFNFGISPLVFVAGRRLRIEIKADSVALIGTAATQMPNFSGQFGMGVFMDIAYQNDIPSTEQTKSAIEALTGDDRLDANSLKNLPTPRTDEQIRQVVAAYLQAGNNITFTDENNTRTIASTGGGGVTPPTRTEDTYVNTHTSNDPALYNETGANSADYAVTQTINIPSFTGANRYVSIAQPANEPDLTSITIGGVDQLAAFTKAAGTVQVQGEAYELWYSTNTLIGSIVSNLPMTISRA